MMAVILKCDVTGTTQNVETNPTAYEWTVAVAGKFAKIECKIGFEEPVKHVGRAAIATALRKAAAEISKAGAREAKPDVPKPAGPVKPPKKAKDTE